MSCARAPRPYAFELETNQTTVKFAMADTWEPVEDGAVWDFDLIIQGLSGQFVAKPCLQLAVARADLPDAPAAITDGSYVATVGHTPFHETSAGGTGKLIGRPGVAYKLNTGSTNAGAQIILQSYLKSCLRLHPTRSVQVNPGACSTTDSNFEEITGFLPAAGLSKVKAAFFCTDNASGSDLEYALHLRSATDPRTPNSWQLAETGWTNPAAGNTERNTGQLSAPAGANLTSNTLFQLAIGYRRKSTAETNPRALITAIPGVVYG